VPPSRGIMIAPMSPRTPLTEVVEMDPSLVHLHGLIRSFVKARYRERLERKPAELLDDLSHDLPGKLDWRLAITLGSSTTDDSVLAAVQSVSGSRSAWYASAFGPPPPPGEYKLAEALRYVEFTGAAFASIEPGEIVFYKSEVSKPSRGGITSTRLVLVQESRRRTLMQGMLGD